MKKITILTVFFLITYNVIGQSGQTNNQLISNAQSINTTTNAQKTSNSQDILTNLYKVSIDSILGKNHSFSFNSTFFGLDTIFFGKKMDGKKKNKTEDNSIIEKGTKKEKDLKRYINWQRFLNHNSLNLSLKGDSSNNLTGANVGFTFTIFNHRDLQYSKISRIISELSDSMFNFNSVSIKIEEYINIKNKGKSSSEINDSVNVITQDINAYLKQNSSSLSIKTKQLLNEIITSGDNPTIKFNNIDKKIIQNILTNKEEISHQFFNNIGTQYARKSLFTVSPTLMYGPHSQPTYSFVGDYLFCLNPKPKNKLPWEGELKATYKLLTDISEKNENLDNKPFSASFGLNKVLRQDESKKSTMEFKFFTEDDYQFEKPTTNKFSLNSTFRIKAYQTFWLPISVKYDCNSKVFSAYISITANLSN